MAHLLPEQVVAARKIRRPRLARGRDCTPIQVQLAVDRRPRGQGEDARHGSRPRRPT